MTKRYIVAKKVLEIWNLETEDALTVIESDRVITDEVLVYKNLNAVSMLLTDEQVEFLKSHGISVTDGGNAPLKTQGSDYEKVYTQWVKMVRRNIIGRGCKVAVIDTGCNVNFVPVDFAKNLVDGTTDITDVENHGTKTTSIIKSSIGLAPGCELHHLRITPSAGVVNIGALIASFDYCVTNGIDVANMSFQIDFNVDQHMDVAMDNGTVLVGAAGNSATVEDVLYPANYGRVIAINGVKEDGTPNYYNVRPPVTPNTHGIDFSCNGVLCQLIDSLGQVRAENGTSFSAPFFTGAFALYKEFLKGADNYTVLEYMKNRASNTGDGILTRRLNF